MSGPILFLLLVLAVAACAIVICTDWGEAEELNLHICGEPMAKIGDVVVARIAPTNAAGAPAPVFNVVWAELGDSYSVTPAPDGLSATFVADTAGTGNIVQVSATTKSGATLFAEAALPDVDAVPVDEEAVSLGLTVG